jgi:PHD/YefM family antitoxin component YafN of YafNO toxin-antitoxin module
MALKGALMPRIIPIKELKNTAGISDLCHTAKEPVFITKNGYGDMVIMSIETYEERLFLQDIYRKVDEAEAQIAEGKTRDARLVAAELKAKYGL